MKSLFTKQYLILDFPNLSKINSENSKFANILLSTKDVESTQRAVKQSVAGFQQFLGRKGESTEFEVATKSDLNAQLSSFFASVRSVILIK